MLHIGGGVCSLYSVTKVWDSMLVMPNGFIGGIVDIGR